MNININPCSLAFRANVPETIGLKKANECAKKMLESGSPQERKFAQDYQECLEKLKQSDKIEEVIVQKNYSQDRDIATSFPYTVWIDNFKRLSYTMPIPVTYTALKPNSIEDEQALGVMSKIIIAGQNIDKIASMKI